MEFVKTNLFTVISDIRYFLLTGIKTLPLTIGGTLLIVGLMTANYPMLFFCGGLLVLLPATTFLVNTVFSFFSHYIPMTGMDRNVCNVVTAYDGIDRIAPQVNRQFVDVFTSYWITMTSFFIGYLSYNAFSLYTKEGRTTSGTIDANGNPTDPVAKTKRETGIANRKSQATLAWASLAILLIVVIIIRSSYFKESCDGPLSLIVGLLLGGSAGVGWYYVLSRVGEDRLSDLFGIANRLMIPLALVDKPYACFPEDAA